MSMTMVSVMTGVRDDWYPSQVVPATTAVRDDWRLWQLVSLTTDVCDTCVPDAYSTIHVMPVMSQYAICKIELYPPSFHARQANLILCRGHGVESFIFTARGLFTALGPCQYRVA
jgi:hypothetical protein